MTVQSLLKRSNFVGWQLLSDAERHFIRHADAQRSELAVLLDMMNRRMEEQEKTLNVLLQKFIDDKDDKNDKDGL